MGIVGLVLSVQTPWANALKPELLLSLLGFAFVGGFLYWMANLLAFKNLPTVEVSVLGQGETPTVILGAYFLLGEKLTLVQWAGVGMSLIGACYLAMWLVKKPLPNKELSTPPELQ